MQVKSTGGKKKFVQPLAGEKMSLQINEEQLIKRGRGENARVQEGMFEWKGEGRKKERQVKGQFIEFDYWNRFAL